MGWFECLCCFGQHSVPVSTYDDGLVDDFIAVNPRRNHRKVQGQGGHEIRASTYEGEHGVPEFLDQLINGRGRCKRSGDTSKGKQHMSKLLLFDRDARRGLKPHWAKRIALPADGVVMTASAARRPAAERAEIEWGIEVKALAREMEQCDPRTRERLRRAALNAIYEELVKIRRKRAGDQS